MAIPNFSNLDPLKQDMLSNAPNLGGLSIVADWEDFALPLQPGSGAYWREITVRMYSYIYSIGDEGDSDEPEFVTLSQVDGVTSSRHIPEGVVDPPTLPAWSAVFPLTEVAHHARLDDGAKHEIIVSCAAFDSDADSGWASFVDALGLDVRNVGGSLIKEVAPGLVSPGRLLDFLAGKLGSLLTDSPEVIGSEKIVLHRNEVWERPPATTHWRGGKWAVFYRRGQAAWYLTLWTIELDAGPHASTGIALPPAVTPITPGSVGGGGSGTTVTPSPSPTPSPAPAPESWRQTGRDQMMKPEHAHQYLVSSPLDLAALRVLRGESLSRTSKELGVAQERIKRHLAWLQTDTRENFDLRIRAGMLEELDRIRKRGDDEG